MGNKKSSKSSPVAPVESSVAPIASDVVATSLVATPSAGVTLPARPIVTVATDKAASSTFRGIGSCAHLGIPAGLRRNEFQDRLLERNEAPDMHLSDDALAELMDREHPYGGVRIADRPELVNVIRRFYNAGKHGKQQQGVPAVPSLQYTRPLTRAERLKSGLAPIAEPIAAGQ